MNPSVNIARGAALFVAKSSNVKIRSARGKGEVSTTYVSIDASCPSSCALKADGSCYAQNGHVGMTVRRLDKRSKGVTSKRAGQDEASAIDAAFGGGTVPQDGAKGGRDLRLHTSGDCRTVAAARAVAGAVSRWKARHGGDVWTYTHAWRDVMRSAWGGLVSVLASVDSPADYEAANAQGYALARVVAEHPADGRAFSEHGWTWIPCPAQTRENTGCADCRLCMDSVRLRSNKQGIQFAAHGSRAGKIRRRLTVV